MVLVGGDDGYNPTPDQHSEVVIAVDWFSTEHARTEVRTNAQLRTSSFRLVLRLRGTQSTALRI